MNKEITIIEIINKIANNENMPKKIKYNDKIYIYSEANQDYLECNKDDFDLLGYAFCNWRTRDFINDKVEIIEEDKPMIEKIDGGIITSRGTYINFNDVYKDMSTSYKTIDDIIIKINEIIDYINKNEEK